MKKHIFGKEVFLTALALLIVFASAAMATAPAAKVLTAAGELAEASQIVLDGSKVWEIKLNVNGELIAGLLKSNCRFLDAAGTPTSAEAFFKTYMKRLIAVDFYEDSGVIIECRVGGE